MRDDIVSARIIDGKLVAKKVRISLKPRIAELKKRGVTPGLAAVLIGDDPASATYVGSKARACEKLGLRSMVIRKPADFSQDDLLTIVRKLNEDDSIHGILVQSPLPSHMNEMAVTLALDPAKDVDGFHPMNVGFLSIGAPVMVPCTPQGIIKLLESCDINPEGKEVVVVGRSNIVGKPIASLLSQKGPMGNATVTLAHSRSRDLAAITRRADILIVAVGKPETIRADMISEGCVVIDVGVNRVEDSSVEKGYRLVGDVAFAECATKASAITPVPGGVGPMTIAMLLANTVTAAENQNSVAESE